MRLYALVFCLFWSALLQAQVQPVPATRTALLMGAWDYTDETFPQLPESGIKRDLQLMKEKLEALGFQVTVVENPSGSQAERAVDAFGAALKTRGGASLFYFTGHGAEHEGRNYLIPVGDTNIVEPSDLKDKALSANRILSRMESAGTEVNLVFLDCCRNALTKNGSAEGLAPMTARGSLIGFATRSGDVAETSRQGSDYTRALLAHLATPGISLTDMHTMVTGELVKSGSARRPGNYADLDKIYHLVPVSMVSPPPVSAGVPPVRIPLNPGSMPAVSSTAQPRAGDSMTATLPGGTTLALRYCPAGTFTMGSPASEPDRSDDEQQVQVTLSKGFYMGQTEVTQAQWQAVMGSNPSYFRGDDLPVEQVSWEEAQQFITALNRQTGLPSGWRWSLPTEAQWEYACRAGTRTATAFGDTLTSAQANFDGNNPYGTTVTGVYLGKTKRVGSYEPNAWGLYDTHGNVWEWCLDAWDGASTLPGGTDPLGRTGSDRVDRGGSWLNGGLSCRSANRSRIYPGGVSNGLGFRLAAVPAGAE